MNRRRNSTIPRDASAVRHGGSDLRETRPDTSPGADEQQLGADGNGAAASCAATPARAPARPG